MTHPPAIRTTLLTLFALLLCTLTVCAQDLVPAVFVDPGENLVENPSVTVNESESLTTSANLIPTEKNAEKPKPEKQQLGSEITQARPGERVSNPDHLILNSDTTLGGVLVNGTKPTDMGYLGPGDMRTHLWNGHSEELIDNGITENKLMAMTAAEVQKWHNHFHGVEGSPDHPHDDGKQGHLNTIVQQATMHSSPIYVDDPAGGTVIYEDFGDSNSEYPRFEHGEPEIMYQQGVTIEGTTAYDFETQMHQTIPNQGVIE